MTKQEKFKKRIRARMAATGEKYGAARRVLIEQSARRAEERRWVAEPEVTDAAVLDATGRTWDQWCELIDRSPDAAEGHAAVARALETDHGLDGWWAQTVTVGWERITGRRLPGQMADGTFTANKSRTLKLDAGVVRELLLDDAARADLFGGTAPELRSRRTSKSIRIAMAEGVAEIALVPKDGGRVAVVVQHTGLASPEAIDAWKQHWSDWFDDLEAAAG